MKSIQPWPAIYYFYAIVRIMTRSRQAQGQGLHTMSCKSLILESFQTGTNDMIDALIKPNVGFSINQHQNVLPLPLLAPPQKLIFLIPWLILSWSITQCLSGSGYPANGWWSKNILSFCKVCWQKERCVACVKLFRWPDIKLFGKLSDIWRLMILFKVIN